MFPKLTSALASLTAAALLATGGMLLGGSAAHADPGDIVKFDSPHFQGCINKALGQPEGTKVTRANMESLTKLDCSETDVASAPLALQIGGLEAAINLESLTFSWNDISDITPIASLNKLTSLSIHNTRVKDLSPLSKLKNITKLSLYNNRIESITPLAGLSSLTYLQLGNNSITDISALGKLSALRTLYISSNSFTNIEPLAKLSQLETLNFGSNYRITDLSPVQTLTALKSLSLFQTGISDLSPLNKLTALDYLDASSLYVEANDSNAVVNVPITNIVRDTDGKPVAMSDKNYCADEQCTKLLYTTTGDGVKTHWSTQVTVSNGKQFEFSGTLKRKVLSEGPPTISGTPVPGKVGKAYTYQFDVYGTPSPEVSLVSGAGDLPKGLSLSKTGALTGTPELEGDYEFSVQANNGYDPAPTAKVSLTIAKKELPLVSPELTLNSGEVRPGDELTATGIGFVPGEEVSFTMYSDPFAAGKATVRSDGTLTFSFRIPLGATAGDHRLEAARGSNVLAVARFQVRSANTTTPGITKPTVPPSAAAPSAKKPVTNRSPQGVLAKSGAADSTAGMFGIAAAVTALGGAAVTLTALRSRRRSTER